MAYVYKEASEINEEIRKKHSAQPIPFYDEESRKVVTALLNWLKAFKSVKDTNGYCNYDLLADTVDGQVVAFEVKHRTKNSDAYPSHTMGSGKYNQLAKLLNVLFNKCVLASLWNDGCIWISDVFNDKSHYEHHNMNDTTNVNAKTDGKKIDKNNKFWPKEDTIKFYYCYKCYTNGDKEVIFSKKPLNTKLLNTQQKIALF